MELADRTIAQKMIAGELEIRNPHVNLRKFVDDEVRKELAADLGFSELNEITIDPKQIQPASVDLRLADDFKIVHDKIREVEFNQDLEYKKISRDFIRPGEFALATTQEFIKLPPNLGAEVDGRSSIGRRGLRIENAGWVDPGFEGQITLELKNELSKPINIKSFVGERICQLRIKTIDRDSLNPYNGKYKGQRGATGSKLHLDYEIKEE